MVYTSSFYMKPALWVVSTGALDTPNTVVENSDTVNLYIILAKAIFANIATIPGSYTDFCFGKYSQKQKS